MPLLQLHQYGVCWACDMSIVPHSLSGLFWVFSHSCQREHTSHTNALKVLLIFRAEVWDLGLANPQDKTDQNHTFDSCAALKPADRTARSRLHDGNPIRAEADWPFKLFTGMGGKWGELPDHEGDPNLATAASCCQNNHVWANARRLIMQTGIIKVHPANAIISSLCPSSKEPERFFFLFFFCSPPR